MASILEAWGEDLVRKSLLKKIKDHFGDDIAVLSSSGLASLIVFRKNASTLLNLVNDSDEDEAATNDIQLSWIHEGDGGLIQTLVDNFDADISSQNGKLTTHSLAMLITQPGTQPDENQNIPSTIPRVSKADMSQQIDFELPIQRY